MNKTIDKKQLKKELDYLDKLFTEEGLRKHNWWVCVGSKTNPFMSLSQKIKEYNKWKKNGNKIVF